jgi:hypothetical protein
MSSKSLLLACVTLAIAIVGNNALPGRAARSNETEPPPFGNLKYTFGSDGKLIYILLFYPEFRVSFSFLAPQEF